jgi:hypothetical protein
MIVDQKLQGSLEKIDKAIADARRLAIGSYGSSRNVIALTNVQMLVLGLMAFIDADIADMKDQMAGLEVGYE